MTLKIIKDQLQTLVTRVIWSCGLVARDSKDKIEYILLSRDEREHGMLSLIHRHYTEEYNRDRLVSCNVVSLHT